MKVHSAKKLFPLSHRDDPITSDEAAEKMVESGKLALQEQLIWGLILHRTIYCNVEDFTAKELDIFSSCDTDYYTIQRRLSGLHRKGKIERVQYKENVSPYTFVYRNLKRDGCCVWKLV